MVNGQPTPNRRQSSLLELPRCEGGKACVAGLTVTDNSLGRLIVSGSEVTHFSTNYNKGKTTISGAKINSTKMRVFWHYQKVCVYSQRKRTMTKTITKT